MYITWTRIRKQQFGCENQQVRVICIKNNLNISIKMAFITSDIKTDILAIFVAVTAVAIAYFKWSFTYWKRRGVVTPVPTIPFGNATNAFLQKKTFGAEFQDVYNEYKKKGLKYCGFYFLSKPTLILLDPELIKSVMSKDFQHFTDHSNYVNEQNDPLSGNLFSLKGLKWKNLRTKLTPTFTSGKMKMMFQTLVDCSDELIVLMDKAAKGSEPVDIKEVVARFTTDIIGSCAFGIECNSLKNPNSEFRQYGKKVFEIDFLQALKNLLSICFPEILEFFKISVTRKDVTDFFMNIVNQTVNYREANNVARKDFMHLLIQLKNSGKLQEDDDGNLKLNGVSGKVEDGKTLSLPEVTAQAFIFFLAGFETSSTTLTFCFYELVTNPQVQDKLRKEINEVVAKHGGKINYDSIMDMTYMDKCINETLRKYPPVPFLTRECTKPYEVPQSNLVLEKGASVFIPVLGIQHDPEHYPEPEKFDPERFTPENKAKRHAYTWLPFGEGPRACIGLRFGMMQTKVALAILLKNYKFSLNVKTTIPLVMEPKSVIMSVKDGVWLNTEKIDTSCS